MYRITVYDDDKLIQDIETNAIVAAMNDEHGTRSVLLSHEVGNADMLAILLALDNLKSKIMDNHFSLKLLYAMKDMLVEENTEIDLGMLAKMKEMIDDNDD